MPAGAAPQKNPAKEESNNSRVEATRLAFRLREDFLCPRTLLRRVRSELDFWKGWECKSKQAAERESANDR